MFGVTPIEDKKDKLFLNPQEIEGLIYGISVGVVLSSSVLNGIIDKPTLLYKWHYRQSNNLLDKIAFQLSQYIQLKGFCALPIPASQVIDRECHLGHLSHRSLAEAAGLGWRGRNNLLVSPLYGAHVRLVSILTDYPLINDSSIPFGCSSCHQCVSACPVGALGKSAADYQLDKCYALLKEFSKLPGIGQHICGLCVKACSGRGRKKSEE